MNIIESLAKQFESEKISTFEDVDAFDGSMPWVSTGNPSFDLFMKTHGWPKGIIEIRGESQSGKTTMSLHSMLSMQRQYGERSVIVVLSSERRDNRAYARQIGIDVNNILIIKITTMEDARNKVFQTISKANSIYENKIMEEILDDNPKLAKGGEKMKELMKEKLKEKGKVRYFFIWDSMGQTIASQELEKAKQNAAKNENGKAALGAAARALGETFRAWIALQDEEDVTFFVINRPYDKVDGSPGKKSYGGKAIMLFPTMRVDMTRIQGVKIGSGEESEECGQITEITMVKNDFDNPKQKYKIEIGYGYGFVLNQNDVELGEKHGILQKFGRTGATFKFGNKELKWGTRKELYKLYEEKNPILNVLIKKLIDAAHKEVMEYWMKKED